MQKRERRPGILDTAGLTLIELLIASAVTVGITGAVLGLVRPAQGLFQAQPEMSDMHQRLRVGIDAIAKDLVMAGAGLQPSDLAGVMPYRVGDQDPDSDRGVFYRSDTVSILYVPWTEAAIVSHTYYLNSDPATGTSRLMRYDGAETDLPVVDHVVKLEFEYFGAGDAPLDPGILQDGPWVPDDPGAVSFDADLLRIRRVRVTLRIEAVLDSMRGPSGVLFARGGTSTSSERYLPDEEIQFDVAPRNLNLDR